MTDACSFCGTINPPEETVCRNLKCSHDAHVARVDCQCYQCTCFPASLTHGQRSRPVPAAKDA